LRISAGDTAQRDVLEDRSIAATLRKTPPISNIIYHLSRAGARGISTWREKKKHAAARSAAKEDGKGMALLARLVLSKKQ